MKYPSKKEISLTLIFCLLISLLPSCTKKDPYADIDHNINVPRNVSADDEWWDSTEFSVIADGASFDINSPDVVVNCNIKAVTENNV